VSDPTDDAKSVLFLRLPPALKQRLQKHARLLGVNANADAIILLTRALDAEDAATSGQGR
jgi:hypothetical protein